MKKPKLLHGDLIIHGLLGQLWLIRIVGERRTAIIVSIDSGHGFVENADDIGLFLKGNNTKIIGNIFGKRKIV